MVCPNAFVLRIRVTSVKPSTCSQSCAGFGRSWMLGPSGSDHPKLVQLPTTYVFLLPAVFRSAPPRYEYV